MGAVIGRSAGSERIIETFERTLSTARARGGDIKSVAESRLGPLEAGINAALGVQADAHAKLEEANAGLMAADADSDLTVGGVLDEMWNAAGRPASSIDYNAIAGSGVKQWTSGDPGKQPLLMKVLANNILAATMPSLQARKGDWAQRIAAKAEAQAMAAAPFAQAEAAAMVADYPVRTLADMAQVALARLKRDFKNNGMTEAQIHEVIPAYEAKPRKVPAGPATPSTPSAPTNP